MSDMTPSEARKILDDSFLHLTEIEMHLYLERALATLAAMRVEHDHGVVTWEEVDGRYEVYSRTRLVSDWRDADPAEAAD